MMFRSILPVVSTECDVLIVCRKHNDKEWKFKEQHAKMWENIAGAKRYSRPRGFNIAGRASPSPPPFRRLCNSLRQTVHTRRAAVHQAAKLVAALLMVARVTAGMAKVMAAYRWVYDSCHLQADCQEPGSAPEPYAR